jgi:hypothetical protein
VFVHQPSIHEFHHVGSRRLVNDVVGVAMELNRETLAWMSERVTDQVALPMVESREPAKFLLDRRELAGASLDICM